MNAEVCAKGLEKCGLLTRLLGQIVENLDDSGCPKIEELVKTDSSRICSGYHSDTKQGFTVPRGKQRCMEKGLCNMCKFLYVFIVFVFTTNLCVQLDMIFSIAFTLRNWADQTDDWSRR